MLLIGIVLLLIGVFFVMSRCVRAMIRYRGVVAERDVITEEYKAYREKFDGLTGVSDINKKEPQGLPKVVGITPTGSDCFVTFAGINTDEKWGDEIRILSGREFSLHVMLRGIKIEPVGDADLKCVEIRWEV